MVLLGERQPGRVVERSQILESAEDELAPIRASNPVVEWFGVNERRVDAVVSTADDEYRIVYFTADGETVDALSVFRRPPRFEGVAGGRVVVVNGPSGSGKSTLLMALVDHSPLPWVVFDEPAIGLVDQAYLIWRDRAPQLHRGFLDAIAALARRGNLVGLSAAGHPAAAIDEAFDGLAVLRVGLDCDVPTLSERERGREGRWGGIVAASRSVHDGWRYDARYDTARQSTATIVGEVLRLIGPVG
jgi:chloramphenicol 3-O-phosphotransferase